MAHGMTRRQAGFSLIEQIMALLIVAVLITVAVPSMHQFIRQHRLQVVQSDYIAGLRYARDTAITQGVRTLFCSSRDGHSCNGTAVWNGGWLVGLDPNATGQPDGEPLYVGGKEASALTVLASDSKKLVRFQPSGSAGGTNQTFLLCQHGDSREALLVVVANYGRIRGDVASAEQASSCASTD